MVDVCIENGSAVFEVEGLHTLWALKSRLSIPLQHIRRAQRDPDPKMGWFQGLKVIGTDVPNVFRAGTFYENGGLVFWDVRHPENAVMIELHDERYKRLIVEVADPDAVVALINAAVAETHE